MPFAWSRRGPAGAGWGTETFEWESRDIFSMPHGNWIAHEARSKTAKLFVVTDREVLRRLDLLTEEYGNERR